MHTSNVASCCVGVGDAEKEDIDLFCSLYSPGSSLSSLDRLSRGEGQRRRGGISHPSPAAADGVPHGSYSRSAPSSPSSSLSSLGGGVAPPSPFVTITVRELGPGDVFGEDCLRGVGPNSSYGAAVRDTAEVGSSGRKTKFRNQSLCIYR